MTERRDKVLLAACLGSHMVSVVNDGDSQADDLGAVFALMGHKSFPAEVKPSQTIRQLEGDCLEARRRLLAAKVIDMHLLQPHHRYLAG